MALQAKYQRYLATPTVDALAANAAINYIPTLSTINGPTAILKHLRTQDEQLTKKNEKFLNVIESATSLCVETETTLQFLYGGGAYLPGMDDNFLVDRVVTVLIVHIVSFDAEQKIQQIRLLWDQGSLLKSIDVIGRSGRNWPLHDGKDQARLITSSASATPSVVATTTEQKPVQQHSKFASKDAPHQPLDLFSPHTFEREESPRNPVAPRESAKPPPRDYGDLFASRETAAGESTSPSKRRESHIKIGAGKNYSANRLFDQTIEQPIQANASIKTNPDKFNHFNFDDGPIPQATKETKPNGHGAQWEFADFSTPVQKAGPRRAQDVRHFALGDDEGDEVKVPAMNHVAKGRRDAAAHFSFDDVTPQGEKQQPFQPGRAGGNGRTGLYEDHVTDQNGADVKRDQPFEPQRGACTGRAGTAGLYEDHIINQPSPANHDKDVAKVLSPITNVNQHRKTFDSTWNMADTRDENVNAKNLGQAKQRAGKTMEAHWSMYDESPQKQTGIKIAGNGMGSRSGASGWWDF